jgi:hypothetical protein
VSLKQHGLARIGNFSHPSPFLFTLTAEKQCFGGIIVFPSNPKNYSIISKTFPQKMKRKGKSIFKNDPLRITEHNGRILVRNKTASLSPFKSEMSLFIWSAAVRKKHSLKRTHLPKVGSLSFHCGHKL